MNRSRLQHMGLLAVLLCAALVAVPSRSALAQASGAAEPKPAAGDKASGGSAQNGKQLFTADGCYECHGRAAQGGVGPRIGPRPIPLAALITYVRQPSGEMPPYTAKVITDAELTDIYAFLQSIPDPPKVDTIPLLK